MSISNRQLKKIEWKIRQKIMKDALKKNAYGDSDPTPYCALTGNTPYETKCPIERKTA